MSDPEDTREPSCRWNPAYKTRTLDGRHDVDCPDEDGCRGCQACPRGHCETCGRAHVDHAGADCATCVGEVREGLDAIAAMSTRMLVEATVVGVNSEAAMLAAPAADPEIWHRRHRLIVNAALHGPDQSPAARRLAAWIEDCQDEAHPMWVLGEWDLRVATHYGHERTTRATLSGAWSYLKRNLTDLAADPTFELAPLRDEIRACRAHMEDVLQEGERDETGAPCPACRDRGAEKVPVLVKEYAGDPCSHDTPARRTLAYWLTLGYPEAVTAADARAARQPCGRCDQQTRDRWRCPRCRSTWSPAEYRMRVVGDYLTEADRLTAPDIERQYHVPAGTVRVWANRGKVTRRGRDESGRQLYDVDDVLTARDTRDTRITEMDGESEHDVV